MLGDRLRTIVTCALLVLAGPSAAEIVLVSARSGNIEAVTGDEAEQLYLGRLAALRDGTPVRLTDLPPGETRDHFYQRLTGKNGTQTRAYWSRIVFSGRARPPQQVSGVAELNASLNRNPNLIGYLHAAEVTPDMRVLLRLP